VIDVPDLDTAEPQYHVALAQPAPPCGRCGVNLVDEGTARPLHPNQRSLFLAEFGLQFDA